MADALSIYIIALHFIYKFSTRYSLYLLFPFKSIYEVFFDDDLSGTSACSIRESSLVYARAANRGRYRVETAHVGRWSVHSGDASTQHRAAAHART